MTYELALALKTAGYPQDTLLGIWKGATQPLLLGDCPKTWGDTVAYPTLSELIEECGDGFRVLISFGKEFEARNTNDSQDVYFGNYKFGKGNTPSEAVALLYLALNKK